MPPRPLLQRPDTRKRLRGVGGGQARPGRGQVSVGRSMLPSGRVTAEEVRRSPPPLHFTEPSPSWTATGTGGSMSLRTRKKGPCLIQRNKVSVKVSTFSHLRDGLSHGAGFLSTGRVTLNWITVDGLRPLMA